MHPSEKSLFVVEPDDRDYELIRTALTEGGYQYITRFKTPEEAYNSPELKLCDMIISEIDFGYCRINGNNSYFDGYDLCEMLSGEKNFIFLTYRDRDKDIFKGWMKGSSCYLTKPFDRVELLVFIERIFRSSEDSCEDEQ